jgi:hypothetical protein
MLPVGIIIGLGLLFCLFMYALVEAKRARKSRLWKLVFSRTKWLKEKQPELAQKGSEEDE